MSAVLLPLSTEGAIDWDAVEAHIARTVAAGLTPAVNMDTGYVQLLDDADKDRVLDLATKVAGGNFVAGAYVADEPGATFECRLDGVRLSRCRSPLKLTRLRRGKHVFKVVATDAAGNTDPTPATHRFKVRRKRR